MWLAALLFVFILGLLAYLDTRKPKNYPPGPKWYPLVGNALALMKERKKIGTLSETTAQMSKEYGPVLGLKVGTVLVVIVNGKEGIKELLGSEDFTGRPMGPFFELRTWGKRRGILLTDSEFWAEQRRFVLRQLREFGFGRKNMSVMIEEEGRIMVEGVTKAIKENGGKVAHNMESFFNIHILNTLWTMLAGIRYSPEDKDLKKLQGILSDMFGALDMSGAPFSYFPILRFLAPELSGYAIYKRTHTHIWDFLNAELKRHKETYKPNQPRDFMDVYLDVLNSPERKASFSEEQLIAICMDMFMAGSETTSKVLCYGILNLMLYPEVQRKAQEEIDRVVGRDRIPTIEDRPNLPYVECVVLESLRMFAARALTVPHRALKETTINGYTIPKDTMILGNLCGLMYAPESGFEKPAEFIPERYLKNGKITLDENYLPFGFGKRRCMGETLARTNVFLFIAALLQNFNFSIVPECPPSLENADGVTPGPKSFQSLLTLRT